jgi:hypothetical protein
MPPSSSIKELSISSSSKSEAFSDSNGNWQDIHHWNKKKSSRQHTKGKSKPQEKFTGSDPSVGDKKRTFRLLINGREIDATAGPPNMRDKDMMELYS